MRFPLWSVPAPVPVPVPAPVPPVWSVQLCSRESWLLQCRARPLQLALCKKSTVAAYYAPGRRLCSRSHAAMLTQIVGSKKRSKRAVPRLLPDAHPRSYYSLDWDRWDGFEPTGAVGESGRRRRRRPGDPGRAGPVRARRTIHNWSLAGASIFFALHGAQSWAILAWLGWRCIMMI